MNTKKIKNMIFYTIIILFTIMIIYFIAQSVRAYNDPTGQIEYPISGLKDENKNKNLD